MIPYYDIIMEAADREGIPFDVAKYLIERESQFNPNAVSPQGAGGIAQLMPETAKMLGVKNRFDPAEAIPAGLKYLKQGFNKYGTWGQAGGYYHSGPGNMANAGGDITKLGPRGREYANAFSTRFDKPDYLPNVAPMNPQGQPVPPTVLPASTNTPQVIPPPSTGAPQMDEYESMKIFNPYVQMALGILSGNSGVNKSQAFANAMGGGLNAVQGAQKASAYSGQVKAQQAHYDAMQRRIQLQQQYAMQKAQDPNLPPEQREAWALAAATGNIGDATKQLNDMTNNALQQKRIDLEQKRYELDVNKQTGKNANVITLNLGEDHPMNGWQVKDDDLLDRNGVKQTGQRKDWALDMIGRPPKQVMPQKEWADKNDPTRNILPQNFSNWLDKEGNYLTESLPANEVVQKGYRYVDDKERADYRAAKVQLEEIKNQWNNLFGEEGVYSKAKEFKGNDLERLFAGGKATLASTYAGSDPVSIKIREFNKFVDRTLPSYAREVGHTGVLTQLDVESVKPSIGMITPEYMRGKFFPDTEQELKHGLRTLYKLYKSRGIENKELDKLMEELEESNPSNKPIATFSDGTVIERVR